MNRSFCPIWNDLLCTYVPAPESARRRGKGASVRAALGSVLCAISFAAQALPVGGEVSAGQGSIAQGGSAMTVNQQSQNLSINWGSFGIGASESVRFSQPNASAIALNRVLGADPTQIYGRLTSNGKVWILNPHGVLFGGGAQVNVGGLLASTLNISDADFLSGKRTFSGSGGTVANQGSITAADGSYVALLGGKVSNEGVIQARLGTAALGAGKQVTLDFAGDKLLNLQVDEGVVNALAQNKQLIQADGGTVLLSARAAHGLLDTVVNNTGVIEARTIESRNGTIKLLGGLDGGTVQVGGRLDASAPNGGDGGFIETSGARVSTAADARITTAAPQGRTGQWLIDPTDFKIAPAGGDMTGAALASQLGGTNVTILSSNGSAEGSGDVKVNDNIVWNSANGLTLSAYHDVQLVKSITNSGTGGVTLRADNGGNCVAGASKCGTIRFAPMAGISVNGGAVNLYYNPAGSNKAADANGNGPSYASPTDYGSHITLNGASTFNAWMLVNDVNQLQAMNTNLEGYYALGRDVDAAATAGWNAGAGFSPIGAFPSSFSGWLDGQLHTISGLTINQPSSTDVGLFRQNNGHITNLGLLGGTVSGALDVGGLVGFNAGFVGNSYSTGVVNGWDRVGGLVGFNSGGSTVSNSYSTGYVGGRGSSVGGLAGTNSGIVTGSHSTGDVSGGFSHSAAAGGLIGSNDGGVVTKSYSTGGVTGYTDVGGLIGYSRNGAVSDSYSTGGVYGVNIAGGLIGFNDGGTVINSHSTGNVSVGQFGGVGGLVGNNSGVVSSSYSTGNVAAYGHDAAAGGLIGSNWGTVNNSYSTGAVTAEGYGGVGGLIGVNNGAVSSSYSTGAVSGAAGYSITGGLVGTNAGTVTDSYWDITTSGQTTSAGGTGLSDAQMKQKGSFTGFDFIDIWDINEGVSYPFLRVE